MASKKKQEEKHLKILRELVAEPGNKKCAECRQRGPTYVDMTVATFVCTTCSGLLRGINPPHRVKSITMTSFSLEEIEKIRNAGNEKCNQMYLAKWSEGRDPGPETLEELKIKFFLQDKYERKRWYSEQGSPLPPQPLKGSNTPEMKPLSQLLGSGAPRLVVGTGTGSATSTPPVSRSSHPGTPNLPAPPGVQRKGSAHGHPQVQLPSQPQPKQDSLLDLNDVFSAPAPQPTKPFGGQAVFPPGAAQAAPAPASGGFGDFTSFSSAPAAQGSSPFGAPAVSNTAAPASSSMFGSSLNTATPALSGSDKYAVFSGIDSKPAISQPATGVDWTGGVQWGSSSSSSSNPATDGRNWSQQQQQQQQSTMPGLSATSGMSAVSGMPATSGMSSNSQMNWGGVANSSNASAMSWGQQQQQQQPFSSNPFGSGMPQQQQQPQQQQLQQQQQQPKGNPFGGLGNIGGKTRGPADASLFTKPTQQQQQQQPQQNFGQQPGGFGMQQQQQQPAGYAMQQPQQPGGFGMQQQQPSGFGMPQQQQQPSGFGMQQQQPAGFGMQQQQQPAGFGQQQPSMGGFGMQQGGYSQGFAQQGGFPQQQQGFNQMGGGGGGGGFGQMQSGFGGQMQPPQGQSFGGWGQPQQQQQQQQQQMPQQSNPFMGGGQAGQSQMMGRGTMNPFM